MNDLPQRVVDAIAGLRQPCSQWNDSLQRALVPATAVVFGIVVVGLCFFMPEDTTEEVCELVFGRRRSPDQIRNDNFLSYHLVMLAACFVYACWFAFLTGVIITYLGRFAEKVLPAAIPICCIVVPIVACLIVLRVLFG